MCLHAFWNLRGKRQTESFLKPLQLSPAETARLLGHKTLGWQSVVEKDLLFLEYVCVYKYTDVYVCVYLLRVITITEIKQML